MSHTTHIKSLAIRDVSAMRTATQALKAKGVNVELLENAKPRMYYDNQHGKCAFVLNLKDSPYDVGFDAQKDGTYSPVFDEWGQHVAKQIGAKDASGKACPIPTTPEERAMWAMGAWTQEYALAAATNQAVSQGYMVESSSMDQHGNVQLVLTGM